MKYGVWSGFYRDLSPEDAVLEFEKHGYNYSDLCFQHSVALVNRGDIAAEGRKFKEFAKAHGVTFCQAHFSTQCFLCQPEGLEMLKKQLDLYVAMKIKYAILHCDAMTYSPEISLEEVRAHNLEALRELVSYAADRGTLICLENLRKVVPVAMSADDLLYFLNELGSDKLGICLDIGHLNQTNANTSAEFLEKVGKNLRAVHINVNDGTSDQHLLPFTIGKIDIMAFTRELRRAGFDGFYDLELPGECRAPLEIRGYKLDYIKQMTNYIDLNTACN